MGPLAGIRIVEFDAIGPVPLCCTLLADMGAEIVRIARASGQAAFDSLGEAILHRGRDLVELNLKLKADRDAALDLVARADILIEGFRPGVMERLGLGPDVCLARNPRLVYGRMTGWGQTGALAPRAGHDINYIAIAGALSAIGARDGVPIPPLNLVADYGGGALFLAMGVLAAHAEAARSGKGQVVDVAMTDGVNMLLSMFHALRQGGFWQEGRAQNLLDGGVPFYRCYETSDGGFMSVGALEPQFYAELLAGVGIPAADFPQYDRARWPALEAALAQRFASRTRDEWDGVFSGRDACVYPVLSMAEAVEHGQGRGREAFADIDGIVHPAPAPRFSRTPSQIRPSGKLDAAVALQRWS